MSALISSSISVPLASEADELGRRVTAVDRFVALAAPMLPAPELAAARRLVERANTRLTLSGAHTVVALAGTTGSGKSSLFNAVARMDLSPVGVRRPMTSTAHACVWGPAEGTAGLLDWVGVAPRERFIRESVLDGDDEAALHGLVLLDLPDFDSISGAHRIEVDRLLGLVDLVVWVVDPQKYADRSLHASYLRQYGSRQDVTVVVLNQADRLSYDDVAQVLSDLKRLLADEGLGEIPVLATSATADGGLTGLRTALQRTVAHRKAAGRRWHAEVDAVLEQLWPYVRAAVAEDAVDRADVRRLATALGAAAAVPAAADAAAADYVRRARVATGWPPMRWLTALRRDPPGRQRPPDHGVGSARREEPQRPRPGAGMAVQQAALAVREIGERAGAGLPPPWPAAVLAAARSRLADLPSALALAVARPDLGLRVVPGWWRAGQALQWAGTVALLVGTGWLILDYVRQVLGLPPLEVARLGDLSLQAHLAGGGLLLGVLGALAARPLVRLGSRRAERRARRALDAAVTEVARHLVVTPMREVLHDYAELRAALAAATAASSSD